MASLKRDIVVVNEFTVKNPGHAPTRGASPGRYVTRYMSREDAVEQVAASPSAYIGGYMARADATVSLDGPKYRVRKTHKRDGVGFGGIGSDTKVSLTNRELTTISNAIQDRFETGGAVMKTVLSFDSNYLKERGVLPAHADTVSPKRGAYRGQVDQAKLRLAVMEGVRRLGTGYDALAWVGTVQLDTKHVHVHLAMCDLGERRQTKHGYSKGTLSRADMMKLRRGIDSTLDSMSAALTYAREASSARAEIRTLAKARTYEHLREGFDVQLLTACLPAGTHLWRAGSNRAEMRRANLVCEAIVESVIRDNPAAYERFMDDTRRYAKARAKREGLDYNAEQALVESGRRRMVREAMDGIYTVMIAHRERLNRELTPTMTHMVRALDHVRVPASLDSDPLQRFCVKLRVYSQRKADAAEKLANIESNLLQIMRQEAQLPEGAVLPGVALKNQLQVERLYQQMRLDKYQHLLPIDTSGVLVDPRLAQVCALDRKITNGQMMLADRGLSRMDPQRAEAHALAVYGQRGGKLLVTNRALFERHMDQMLADREKYAGQIVSKLHLAGHQFDGAGHIKRRQLVPFNEVRYVDIHDMDVDEASLEIGAATAREFIETYQVRAQMFDAAKDYLESTGQAEAVADLPGIDDLPRMKRVAERLEGGQSAFEEREETVSVQVARMIEVDDQAFFDSVRRRVLEAMEEEQEEREVE